MGKVYVRATRPFFASYLDIQVEGAEQVQWQEDAADTQARKRIFEFKQRVCTFKQMIQPGDYSLEFEFVLPTHCPGSMLSVYPSAETQFKIVASLGENRYEHLLLVQDAPQ